MIPILGHIIRMDEDVVKIYYYTNIEKIQEDIVYKLLKGCRSVSQTERHNYLFKRFIASTESYFLFVTFYNLYQIICMIEVNIYIYIYLPGWVKKVGYQRKWVLFFHIIQLSPQKSTYRQRELYFFFIKSTSAREKVEYMNLVLRFLLMNFLNASCLMVLTDSFSPFSNLICRLYR